MAHQLKPLGALCVQDRTLIRPDSPNAQNMPFLGLESIESGTGRILQEGLSGGAYPNSVTFLFDPRHVLYCKLRPYLNKVAVPDFQGRCTTELIPLLPNKNVCREFLAWLLRKPQIVQAAMRERTGARMPRANMRYILAQEVLIPDSMEEQQEMADEMNYRMRLVSETRMACNEQLRLLVAYEQRVLHEFPFISEISKYNGLKE